MGFVDRGFQGTVPQRVYAGYYIPAFAARVRQGNKAKEGIHVNMKGFAIGNGLTDSGIQFAAYADYALDLGIIAQFAHDCINKILPLCESEIKLCDKAAYYYSYNIFVQESA